MNSFSKSFLLVKQSALVLKSEREILLFPLLSSLATVIVAFSIFLPAHLLLGGQATKAPVSYIILFLFYLVNYFVITFFTTGLVTCTYMKLNGQDPTFADGIANAKKHIGKIFIWALISATVGMFLRLIAERSGIFGRIVLSFIGMAWSLLTYFIVPILAYENLGVVDSIKESGSLFKKNMGRECNRKYINDFMLFSPINVRSTSYDNVRIETIHSCHNRSVCYYGCILGNSRHCCI